VSDAIVLAGHGSRSAEANDAVVVLARSLASQLGIPVYPGFLEMSSPAIPDAFRAAHAAGATRIVLLPYFLLPGMHVRRDLTELADAGRAELGVPIEIAGFLGTHAEIPRLLGDLSREALASSRVS
jgi:sirohydrochlorin cobaltochelatase